LIAESAGSNIVALVTVIYTQLAAAELAERVDPLPLNADESVIFPSLPVAPRVMNVCKGASNEP